jgi:hypothetical protein
VLIHIEVQTTRESDFPERIYVYNYRIFDHYNVAVASLVVLADDDLNWRPNEFHHCVFDCEAGIRFNPVKLLDFASHEAMLEASTNPFAKVVLAHLKTMQTHDKPADRHTWKVRLVRGLYDLGFNAKDVGELRRIIDWMMELPPPLRAVYTHDLAKFQQERRMPFITSEEHVAAERAARKAIEAVLDVRFGEEGLKLMPEIREIYGEEQLEAILKAVKTLPNLDEARQLWAPKS